MELYIHFFFYIAGLCSVFAVGAFVADYILPRFFPTEEGPRPMAHRLPTKNSKQSSPQRSNTR